MDVKKRILNVQTAIRSKGNSAGTKDPKSHNGFRQVPMPDFLIDFLKEYLPTLESPYLIHRKDGGIITKSSYDKMWAQIK